MGPNVCRCTGQWLHTDLLAAVQLPDGTHHYVHGIKHQGSRQLREGQRWDGTGKRQLSQGSLLFRGGNVGKSVPEQPVVSPPKGVFMGLRVRLYLGICMSM